MKKRNGRDHGKNKALKRRWIREFILGGQDGLVNVLGLILGVASATQDVKIVLVAGISALFAESISMGAVAYTSSNAAWDFYRSIQEREAQKIEDAPRVKEDEVYRIYAAKGFRGGLLNKIVKTITFDKRLWLETLMRDGLHLFPDQSQNPGKVGRIVFLATIIGSLIPLIPFFFLGVMKGMAVSFFISIAALFVAGALEAKYTRGSWKKSGAELALIGTVAAVSGYVIGKILERLFL